MPVSENYGAPHNHIALDVANPIKHLLLVSEDIMIRLACM